ncbi:flagellar hook-length control protein FliK [Rhizobium sp. G187]|uniref:flagellar hook-length control protein FliK n=1 Tax=Rhizobium sp. G187 TaxID=3451352 RepID=UPI003EE60F8E
MTMMDALVAPRTTSPDAALSRSGTAGRADGQGEDGFSKVMSSAGRNDSREQKATDDQVDAEDGAEGGEIPGETRQATGKKPIIEISGQLQQAAQTAQEKVADHFAGLVVKAADGKAQKGETAVRAGKGEKADKADASAKSDLESALEGIGEGDGTDVETAETVVVEAKTDGIGDVLQLLSSAVGEAVSEAVQADTADGRKTAVDAKAELSMARADSEARISGGSTDTGTEGGGSDGDRTFRFVRADGKGQALTMRSETAASQAEQTEPTKVETVTVMDARRFIAPASTSNGAAVTAAMLGDSEWVNAMQPGSELANAATQTSQGKVVHTLKLQMTPIELGSVTATLKLVGDELSVQLTVDNHAALRQLQSDQSDMLKALKAQGLTVDQVQVTLQLAPTDKSADTAGQSSTSGQQLGQQAQQSGSQAGNQERREAAGNMTRTADDRSAQELTAQASGAGSQSSGQLYI